MNQINASTEAQDALLTCLRSYFDHVAPGDWRVLTFDDSSTLMCDRREDGVVRLVLGRASVANLPPSSEWREEP